MKPPFTFYKHQLFIFFGLLLFSFASFGQSGRLTEVQTAPDGYEYILYLPDGYDPGFQTEKPVLLYLHGGQGIDDAHQKFGDPVNANNGFSAFAYGIPRLIHNKLNGTVHPPFAENNFDEFIIIVPKLPKDFSIPRNEDQLWDVVKLKNVIDHVFAEHTENLEKVYISGISLGAKGVWDYAMA
jgi:poly(3-hydroxybutyrate) depolymerase